MFVLSFIQASQTSGKNRGEEKRVTEGEKRREMWQKEKNGQKYDLFYIFFCNFINWDLYQMVKQKTTCDGKQIFFLKKKNQICDCFRSNQIPEIDQISYITPHMRTYFLLII